METRGLGKLFILAGVAFVLIGLLFYSGKFPTFLGRLPGDIRIERPNFRFYFPFTTGIVLSLLLSLILYLISRLK